MLLVLYRNRGGGDIKNFKKIPFNSKEILEKKPESIKYINAYNNGSYFTPTFYKNYSTDRKIQNIWLSGNKIAQLRLIYFLQKKTSKFTIEQINILNNISDNEFFQKYVDTYTATETAEKGRGSNKAKSIYDSFLKYQFETEAKQTIKSIMDVACGEGYILDALKDLFGIKVQQDRNGRYNCLGLEIDMDYVTNEPKKSPKFPFIKYYSLPQCIFPNLLTAEDLIYNKAENRKRSEVKTEKKYDLITIILGLHHFDDFGVVLKQVYNSLENNGLLLIRDHNVINCLDLMLVELEHLIPDFQRGAKGESNGCYLSSYSQDVLLDQYGFKMVYTNFLTEDRYDTIERNIHTTNINDRFYKKK